MRDSPSVEPRSCGGEKRSYATTCAPRLVRRQAAAAPMAPHPTTATFTVAYSVATRAIGCPALTCSPSRTSSSSTVPLTGEGISALTLSVRASTSVSPSSTWSPAFLIQAPDVADQAEHTQQRAQHRLFCVRVLAHVAEHRGSGPDALVLLRVVAKCHAVAEPEQARVGFALAGEDAQQAGLAGAVQAHDE